MFEVMIDSDGDYQLQLTAVPGRYTSPVTSPTVIEGALALGRWANIWRNTW